MDNTILLTGATGYLGNHIGRQLLADGYNVVALYLNYEEQFLYHKQYENKVIKIYLSDTSTEDIFKNNKIDGIIHTSTLYGRSGENIADMINANIIFPVKLLTNAINNNVKFFINTDTILNKYISPYALTKHSFVEWLNFYSDKMKMIDVKLDHFYGPKDKNTKFIAQVLEKLINNEKEIDLTEGTQTRDFIYIDDVVEVYRTILSNIEKINTKQTSVFEIGTNNKTSIKYIVETLKKLTNSNTKLNFGKIPYRKNEILDYDIDTTAIRLLGWHPKVNIDEGLNKIVMAEKESNKEYN